MCPNFKSIIQIIAIFFFCATTIFYDVTARSNINQLLLLTLTFNFITLVRKTNITN